MLDTNNHLYQWLKSPTCTILGTKNDRCLQDKIILDSKNKLHIVELNSPEENTATIKNNKFIN